MAKSAWKYNNYTNIDVENYFINLFSENSYKSEILLRNNRSFKLNKLNYNFRYRVHQGKFSVIKRFLIYSINKKLGEFSKTRRPFYFRSKKKKNVI